MTSEDRDSSRPSDAKEPRSSHARPDSEASDLDADGAHSSDTPRDSKSASGAASGASEAKPPRRSKRTKKNKKQLPIWQETLLLLAVALILAVVIKAFFVQAFYIPSPSMEPGLVKNDRILVEKPSYWGGNGPSRGDVVVFEDPGGWLGPEDNKGPDGLLAKGLAKIGLYPTGGHLVKRVIGVPGDVIVCCDKRGRMSINGHKLDESSYVAKGSPCATPRVDCELDIGPIPKGHYFVMGDNRINSADSTAHMCLDPQEQCPTTRGLVPEDLIVGKVFALVWPRDHMQWIKRPSVFDDVPDDPPAKNP